MRSWEAAREEVEAEAVQKVICFLRGHRWGEEHDAIAEYLASGGSALASGFMPPWRECLHCKKRQWKTGMPWQHKGKAWVDDA